jgi:hypothetical protein
VNWKTCLLGQSDAEQHCLYWAPRIDLMPWVSPCLTALVFAPLATPTEVFAIGSPLATNRMLRIEIRRRDLAR